VRTYKVRKEAAEEIAEAAAWYEAEAGPDLAAEVTASRNPDLCAALAACQARPALPDWTGTAVAQSTPSGCDWVV
jgi:hypothetical protein